MKHKLALAAGLFATLVVAVAAAAPYWTGQVAEEQIRAFAAKSEANYGVPTRIESFERGYAQSTAVTVTSLPLDDEPPFEITVDHVIDHGPKLGQAAVARIASTLRAPADLPPELVAALDGKALFDVLTLVQADTSMNITATMPPLDVAAEAELGRLVFGGMTLNVDIGAGAKTAVLDGNMPQLNVTSPDMQLEMGGVVMSGDLEATEVPSLWIGKTQATITTMRAVPSAPGEPAFDMTGLGVDAGFDRVDDGYGMDIAYRIDAANFDGGNVRNFLLSMRLEKLDAAAMREYMALAMSVNSMLGTTLTDPEAMADLNARLALAGIKLVTEGSPTLQLKALNVDYGSGELRTDGQVRYVGSGDFAQFNPLSDLTAKINLRATEAMVMSVASEFLSRRTYQRPPAELTDEERSTVDGATRYQLTELMRTGMVEQTNDGAYQVRAVLDRGGVLVNDAPTPFLPPPQ